MPYFKDLRQEFLFLFVVLFVVNWWWFQAQISGSLPIDLNPPIQSFFVAAKSFLLAGKILRDPKKIDYFLAKVSNVYCDVVVYGNLKKFLKSLS
jgi:hypothetical protein